MSRPRASFMEELCDRFTLAQEATGLSAKAFGERVGLTSQKMTNIKIRRNAPSHDALRLAVIEFGFTTDWFYFGSRAGFRDQELAARLHRLSVDRSGSGSAD